jgi:hypothetical protein
MAEDLLDHCGLLDEGDDAHGTCASGTHERIRLVYGTLQPMSPSALPQSMASRRPNLSHPGAVEAERISCFLIILSLARPQAYLFRQWGNLPCEAIPEEILL